MRGMVYTRQLNNLVVRRDLQAARHAGQRLICGRVEVTVEAVATSNLEL